MAFAPFVLDFKNHHNQAVTFFVKDLIEEIDTMRGRLMKKTGLDFGRLSAHLYFEYVHFYFNDSLNEMLNKLRGREFHSYLDPDVREFVYEVLNLAYQSPLSLRAKDQSLWHAYENVVLYESTIFNTTTKTHSADPRVFMRTTSVG